ncbi:MAG: hypothetical protein RSA08_02825 [Clostridia bacterium]
MAMQNVNAIVSLYADIEFPNDPVIFIKPFNKLTAKRNKNGEINDLNGFYVVMNFNLLGSMEKEIDNVINEQKDLMVLLRITKMSKDLEDQKDAFLDSFKISFDNCNKCTDAGIPYISAKKIKYVNLLEHFENISAGMYMIKILVQKENEKNKKDWFLQSFTILTIV